MHNLSTIYWFEVLRALKKKSFWIVAMVFPLMIVAIFGVIYFSNKTTNDESKKLENSSFSFAVTDRSGIIIPGMVTGMKGTMVSDEQSTIQRVQRGELDAYFVYPKTPGKEPTQIYARETTLFENNKYAGVANALLKQSVLAVTPEASANVLQKEPPTKATLYKNGEVYEGLREMIAPGIFLILFYMLISFFGNQMLTSTTEEKENRVMEMLLTTVSARTMIIGKIFGLITLSFIMLLLILVPMVLGYIFLHDTLSLPNIDLTTLPLNWARIGMGALLFGLSFMMFTGLLVMVGAATPTAKEAGSYFGVVMMCIFGPLYAGSLFFSAPDSPIVRFLTYFPLTSPIPSMLRNAIGNLSATDYTIIVCSLFVTMCIVIMLAIRLFRRGAIEYDKKLSLKSLLG